MRFYAVEGSSQIEQIGFEPATEKFYIKFVGAKSLYEYDFVTLEEAAKVMFAESVGSMVNTIIKKGDHPYRKVEWADITVAKAAGGGQSK